MPKALPRKRREGADPAKAQAKPCAGLCLPLRMSGCVFQRPVTRMTAHPGNEVRWQAGQESWAQPRQLCLQKRLHGLQARGPDGETLSPLDLPATLRVLVPGGPDAPEALATPAACPQRLPALVTEDDIRRQERRVKMARERLAVALIAHSLARELEARTP
ncbi:methyl-CpG-binding domain protein 3-like 1 [Ctenodactylus gundi]